MLSRVAVIGGGISGMVSAWLLRERHEVTLFEAGDYLGGHTHTHDLEADGALWPVDSGFIVYNDKTYPNFIKLLKRLGVEGRATTMSFSVMSETDDLEYNGTSINALFAQRRNFLRPMFWRMIKGIMAFNEACKLLVSLPPTDETLGEFLRRHDFPSELGKYYIKPMTAAVWSAGTRCVDDMPIHFIARFFENHGFLNINDRPQWRSVKGGSRAYARKIAEHLGSSVRMNSKVVSVSRTGGKPTVTLMGEDPKVFDHVIFACHSDEALRILNDPTTAEKSILGDIPYVDNDILIHTDLRLMPKRKLAWAAWNYNLFDSESDDVAVTYNMNILQGHDCKTQFLVSLNCGSHIDPSKIIKQLKYRHPVYTTKTIAAQLRHAEISGHNGIHYCGAYWANGFHEDGVVSALRVVQAIDPEASL